MASDNSDHKNTSTFTGPTHAFESTLHRMQHVRAMKNSTKIVHTDQSVVRFGQKSVNMYTTVDGQLKYILNIPRPLNESTKGCIGMFVAGAEARDVSLLIPVKNTKTLCTALIYAVQTVGKDARSYKLERFGTTTNHKTLVTESKNTWTFNCFYNRETRTQKSMGHPSVVHKSFGLFHYSSDFKQDFHKCPYKVSYNALFAQTMRHHKVSEHIMEAFCLRSQTRKNREPLCTAIYTILHCLTGQLIIVTFKIPYEETNWTNEYLRPLDKELEGYINLENVLQTRCFEHGIFEYEIESMMQHVKKQTPIIVWKKGVIETPEPDRELHLCSGVKYTFVSA
jgi:hypothetical protein